MALNNTQYDAIIREYEEKQTRNRHILEERRAEVYAKVEGYRDLSESISSISVAQGKKLLDGDDHALENLRASIKNLTSRKEQLLVGAGYPIDYLQPIYECPNCKDTGYIADEKCHCFKQAIINILYEQSGIQEMLKKENFDTLSYEYYEGEDLARFQNTVKTCKNFIKTFNSDYQNLFFYGTVGTGKSFLSECIAKELIEKGYSVIYSSSVKLFENLTSNIYDYKSKAASQMDLYGCDLLIIDDLGTEYPRNINPSILFSLLNERHLKRKSTIISTNLSLEDFRNLYSDRIFSRISNQCSICKFTGADIRLIKKRLQNRK